MSNTTKPKYGELVPIGGGDPIPLLKERLRIGRRDSCDIVLNFANISGHHALLEIEEGYWFVRDLKSKNGVKVDGKKLTAGMRKRVDPGANIRFAKHEFEMEYSPHDLGAYGSPPQAEQLDDFFSTSLLNRAGLKKDEKK